MTAFNGDLFYQAAVHLINKGTVIGVLNLPLGDVRKDKPVQQQDNQDTPKESHKRIYFRGVR